MKIMVLEPFVYNGKELKPGLVDGSETELSSMSQYGPVRPATSTEIQESYQSLETAEAPIQERESAVLTTRKAKRRI